MSMSLSDTAWQLQAYTKQESLQHISHRDGEVKLGEALHYLSRADVTSSKKFTAALRRLHASGVRYLILGIPEDIGPRANLGRGGSHEAMHAFLTAFLNIQSNQFLDPTVLCVAGTVAVHDLQLRAHYLIPSRSQDRAQLRRLVEALDSRVAEVLTCVYEAGLTPIVIGGGHNNVYPIQKALQSDSATSPLACINIDPHADLRPQEGRHSGNGFTYSLEEGALHYYYVLGLHESYNSEESLEAMDRYSVAYRSFDDIKVRKRWSLDDSVQNSLSKVSAVHKNVQLGIDVDLDSIAGLPVSAETPLGFSLDEVAASVYALASCSMAVRYLHVPEGAPSLHCCSETGRRYVGRALSTLVTAFIKGREEDI